MSFITDGVNLHRSYNLILGFSASRPPAKVLGSFAVADPDRLLYVPTLDRIYANSYTGGIHVINPATLAVVGNIASNVRYGVYMPMAFCPLNNCVYAVNSLNNIDVIDCASQLVVATILIPSLDAISAKFNAATGTIYIGTDASYSIYRIDPASNTVLGHTVVSGNEGPQTFTKYQSGGDLNFGSGFDYWNFAVPGNNLGNSLALGNIQSIVNCADTNNNFVASAMGYIFKVSPAQALVNNYYLPNGAAPFDIDYSPDTKLVYAVHGNGILANHFLILDQTNSLVSASINDPLKSLAYAPNQQIMFAASTSANKLYAVQV